MKHCSEFTLNEWLAYLENSHQQEIQLGLTGIKQVAKVLDLEAPTAKIITVAGTNGKGSTVATLEAIYHAAGYQVASYTSPHLLTFNERIRLNKVPISDTALCHAFSVIEQGRGAVALTYFEMATLAALWHFKQHRLDVIILEVGLGGRLDATNIIDADLAIITTIDFDHQEYLGSTKDSIGFEKAGILRPNQLFVYADLNPPSTVVNQAQALNTQAYFCGRDYDYSLEDNVLSLHFRDEKIQLPKPELHANSVVAAIVSSILLGEVLPLTRNHWELAMKTVFLSGRLEIVKSKIITLLDVAHNQQSVIHLANFIRKFYPEKKIHAVFSGLKDKDIPGLVNPLMDCVHHWYPAQLSVKRAASREQLLNVFSFTENRPVCHQSPLEAYQSACLQAEDGDLIVVYGSFITVAEVMPIVYKNSTCVDKTLV